MRSRPSWQSPADLATWVAATGWLDLILLSTAKPHLEIGVRRPIPGAIGCPKERRILNAFESFPLGSRLAKIRSIKPSCCALLSWTFTGKQPEVGHLVAPFRLDLDGAFE